MPGSRLLLPTHRHHHPHHPQLSHVRSHSLRTGKLSRWGRRPSNGLQESSPFVMCRHLGSGKPLLGVVPGGPRAQGPGVSGGSQLIPCGGRCGGSRPWVWGGGLDVPKEAAGPLVLARSPRHGCFCLSVTTPPGDAHRTHTPERKRTRAGGAQRGDEKRSSPAGHGDPRRYLQVETSRRPEAPGVTGR